MVAVTRKIDFYIGDNGCFISTSHKNAKRGYSLIRINGEIKKLHRFIYEECFGDIPKGHFIRHKCDNPRCINPEHLESGIPKQNSMDMVKRNRSLRGSKNKKSKLTETEVRQIKLLINKGYKFIDIANKYEVSPITISNINTGRTWSHVCI